MELPTLGKHCANDQCKQIDFLPLQCKCGKVFCSEHLQTHRETCEKSRFLTDEELKKIENIFVCSKEGCRERSVVPLVCQRCKKHYCIQHRHLTECKDKTKEELDKERERYAEPVRQFNEAKAIVDKQIENSIAEAKKKSKSKELASKLQLMKIKNKAQGQQSIPLTHRVYFNIHLPSSGPNGGKTLPVFVSKFWSLGKDIVLRTENDSTYHKEYFEKPPEENIPGNDRAANCSHIEYIRTVQEKIFKTPPPLKPPKISEMKDSYPFHPWKPLRDKHVNVFCEMPETFRGIQPNINPADKGFYKLLDIYLTENRAKYVPYTPEQLAKAQEDFITMYNACGKHKGLKDELPGKLHGRKNMYDKKVFKLEMPNRFLSKAPKRVPHSGMTTEYSSNYPKPAYSDFFPYIQENGIYFPQSLSGAGPWQTLCPPAMYCTENCHIGTGLPVRAVVDVNQPDIKKIIHDTRCCTKI
ncbi:uncharacterized protein LOC126736432 [Anthonomus grandis grandis]|uniref:uncharacterized protein LOC126736432 n=1 Tax=Anthonomus grandis grandis TaxID=2921223 RepID=UPI002165D721|nr:uncharacterized protein LOC126736432 [Anthonomus grandis grandis]